MTLFYETPRKWLCDFKRDSNFELMEKLVNERAYLIDQLNMARSIQHDLEKEIYKLNPCPIMEY